MLPPERNEASAGSGGEAYHRVLETEQSSTGRVIGSESVPSAGAWALDLSHGFVM
jgi:hypothetical protein